MDVVKSKNGVPVRLAEGDGFVITAFLTRRRKQLERGRKIWQK
jgi:hypothetical protein